MPHKYTTENIDWLSVNRHLYAERELSAKFYDKFNVLISPSALAQQCYKRGIKPPIINIGCFKKGQLPPNKGVKGIRHSIKTEFTKGNRPANSVNVGTEVFAKDYWKVKVSEPNKWRLKHNLIWETKHGRSIPKGSAVIFLDSNINNFEIENLLLITRAELLQMNRNNYKLMPKELKPSVLALSKLESQIYKSTKYIKD